MNDHEDEPPLTPPPAAFQDEQTNPGASPSPLASSIPPPIGSEYFDRAYKQLLDVHRQQMQRFDDLHDENGPLARVMQQLNLVLFEVRGVRRDFAALTTRTGKLEERMDVAEMRQDDFERRLKGLEGRGGAKPAEPNPSP